MEKFFQEEEAIFRLESATRNGENLFVSGNCTYTLYESTHPTELDNRQGVTFVVNKQLFNSDLSITATLNELDEVLDLQVFGAPSTEDKYLGFFNGIELTFPLPFLVGDIVYEIGRENEPMVIKGFSNCGRQQACCEIGYLDRSTMESWVKNVLSLDFYRKSFTENEIGLKMLSEKLRE